MSKRSSTTSEHAILEEAECENDNCKTPQAQIYFCAFCSSYFCDTCWNKQKSHAPGKQGPDGLPHEKVTIPVVNRLKPTFNPPTDRKEQERLHKDDEDTIWFGIAKDEESKPMFLHYGRYATLIANGVTGKSQRFPRLVTFIGQTGAGKSTLVKVLIELFKSENLVMPTPIVGASHDDNVPTTGDVHLYADPKTFQDQRPMLYVDCEGLEGGECEPLGVQYRHGSASHRRRVSEDESGRSSSRRKWIELGATSSRYLEWAKTKDTCKRQFAVAELYPRLLYTFSDVIVFVLQNAKTFESTVLGKLLGWASSSMEKSVNQPSLPHAIIAINATEPNKDQQKWDVECATQELMQTVASAIERDPTYKQYADYWTKRGKKINTMKDLLECYYSSVRVIRIPRKERYMLVDDQTRKLHNNIKTGCDRSYEAKRAARMLFDSDELNMYLHCAFDHFSKDLEHPFNFKEVAYRQNSIAHDFGGNILKLAVVMQNSSEFEGGEKLFAELSNMVASCIVLQCERRRLPGSPDILFRDYFVKHCIKALIDFCELFWQCEYSHGSDQCVNGQGGHHKGHQNDRGQILQVGGYQASFTARSFEDEWLSLLRNKVNMLQESINTQLADHPNHDIYTVAAQQHLVVMQKFYQRMKVATEFVEHSTCFCCLQDMAEFPLPCGHVLCRLCIRTYGSIIGPDSVELSSCPLFGDKFRNAWQVKFKPDLAGVRILSLDGGGVRGIVELQVLLAIEKYLGNELAVQHFFDLILGTSAGGIIALGLGVAEWSVESCKKKFQSLIREAFTRTQALKRFFTIRPQYDDGPLERALQQQFGERLLFGGPHDDYPRTFFNKVAVTAATGTGTRPVVFANYNHCQSVQGEYDFERPKDYQDELKIWEAARATSAAPLKYRPFRHQKTNREYVDGALYFNNPCSVAFHESKKIWPDVADQHPDILLSIGTGQNPGKDEDHADDVGLRRLYKKVSSVFVLMVNRTTNMLDAQQAWENFYRSVVSTNVKPGFNTANRFVRMNPEVQSRLPRLDRVDKMDVLRDEVCDQLDRRYRQEISRIAHQLVASTFYFEMERRNVHKEKDGYFLCKGTICCRFTPDSTALRGLGAFLQGQQGTFQPYFEIHAGEKTHRPDALLITPEIIRDMKTRASFKLDQITIAVENELYPSSITLVLLDTQSRKPERFDISGFPRCLVRNLQKSEVVHEDYEVLDKSPSSKSYKDPATSGSPPQRASQQRFHQGYTTPPSSTTNTDDGANRRSSGPRASALPTGRRKQDSTRSSRTQSQSSAGAQASNVEEEKDSSEYSSVSSPRYSDQSFGENAKGKRR